MYSNKTRVCPFFTSDDRCVIRCEGGTRIKFPDSITTIDYTDRYCGDMDGWKTCTYARQLLDYYDKKNQKENQSEKEKNA